MNCLRRLLPNSIDTYQRANGTGQANNALIQIEPAQCRDGYREIAEVGNELHPNGIVLPTRQVSSATIPLHGSDHCFGPASSQFEIFGPMLQNAAKKSHKWTDIRVNKILLTFLVSCSLQHPLRLCCQPVLRAGVACRACIYLMRR